MTQQNWFRITIPKNFQFCLENLSAHLISNAALAIFIKQPAITASNISSSTDAILI